MKNNHFLFGSAFISLVLLGTAFIAHAASFTDVSGIHTNYDAIEYVKENGIVKGYGDGSFKPDIMINRAEFTKIIIEAVYPNQATGINCFSDVKTEWFAEYVCTAKNLGIIDGYPDGTFKPAQNIAFVEAAKIIVNAFGYTVATNDIWYKPFVIGLGTRNAIPISINELGKNITRAEMAEIIYRLHAQIATKPSNGYENLESMNVQGSNQSVEDWDENVQGANESVDNWDEIDSVTEWQTYENLNIGIRFQYPKNWYILDNGESLGIQNTAEKFDISNAPTGFQLFGLVYKMSDESINSIVAEAEELSKGSPQYSQIEEEGSDEGYMTLKLFTFFDNDCGKSAKAFMEYKDRAYYAFHARFCGQQITDEELIIFKTIIYSLEFLK